MRGEFPVVRLSARDYLALGRSSDSWAQSRRKQDADQDRAGGGARPVRSRAGSGSGYRTRKAEYPCHLRRRHRPDQHLGLQRRPDGLHDAEHRPHRQRGHEVHRLLRRELLHRRPLLLHHRPDPEAHRPLQGRHPRRSGRPAGPRHHHRPGAEAARLRHGAVRQEPPRRPRRVPADRTTASTSSSATSTT